ncbi:hypothetical protein [Methanosarcina barkeri]|uniref:hypothetical protein n=1 Tax=Methanosarcina barkeri TaxID=2208 RepID=UPI001FB43267|nr:hypothetical protein [Methanosarcina barkeri]
MPSGRPQQADRRRSEQCCRLHSRIDSGANLRGAANRIARIFKINGFLTHVPVPWSSLLPTSEIPHGLLVQTG